MPNNYGANSSTLQEGSTDAHGPMHYKVNNRMCEKSRQLRNPIPPCQTVTTRDATRHQEQNGHFPCLFDWNCFLATIVRCVIYLRLDFIIYFASACKAASACFCVHA